MWWSLPVRLVATSALAVPLAIAPPAGAAWHRPQVLPAAGTGGYPRVAIASDGSAAVLDRRERTGGVRVASATPHGRFGAFRTVARDPHSDAAIAAGPHGAALIAWLGRDRALRVAVRRRATVRFVVRRVGAVRGQDISSLVAQHDPRGGWVVAVAGFQGSGSGDVTYAVSLAPSGAVVGAAQRLGAATFGATARPTAVLDVTPSGRAVLVADPAPDDGDGTDPPAPGVRLWTREHGASFVAQAPLGVAASDPAKPAEDAVETATDARVAASDDGRYTVSWTHSTTCGDAGCKGPPRVVTFAADGTPGVETGPAQRYRSRAFGPSAVPTVGGGTLVAWNERDGADPFSPTAPVRAAAVAADGRPAASRLLDGSRLASEPLALPLVGGRALVVWAGAHHVRSAIGGVGTRLTRVAGPAGPAPARFHFNETDRDVRTAGRWAAIAWYADDGRIRVARGRF